MLSIADQHATEAGVNMNLLQADMRDLSALPQYDAITCYADSFCYLDDAAAVQKTFNEIADHLKDNGVFLFDVISPYQTVIRGICSTMKVKTTSERSCGSLLKTMMLIMV